MYQLTWRGCHGCRASQPSNYVGLLAVSVGLAPQSLALVRRFIGRMPSGKRKAEEFASAGLFPEAAEVVVPPESLPPPLQHHPPRSLSCSAFPAFAFGYGMDHADAGNRGIGEQYLAFFCGAISL